MIVCPNLSLFVKDYIIPDELKHIDLVEKYYIKKVYSSIINRLDHETWEIILYSNYTFSPIVDTTHDRLMDHLSDELVDSDELREFIEVIRKDRILTEEEIGSIKFGKL